MLNPRTQQIMYAAYSKVGTISYSICVNLVRGKDNKDLYEQGIKMLTILKVLLRHVRFEDNKVVLYRIKEEQVNQLIACLIKLGKLERFAIPTNYTPIENRNIKIPIRKIYNA